MTATLSSMSDRDLLAATRKAVDEERHSTATLVWLLAEVDSRRLYLGEGYSSMFRFCTGALRLSEPAAYTRITAARTARRLPLVLSRLKNGAVSLTTIGLLAPYLTEENCEVLLDAARSKGKRDVERLVAGFHWQPDIPSSVRALPAKPAPIVPTTARPSDETPALPTKAAAAIAPAKQETTQTRPDAVAPIAPRRYLIRITVGEETHAKLERLRALLRHQVPDGDPAAIVGMALTALLDKTERAKFGAVGRRGTRTTDKATDDTASVHPKSESPKHPRSSSRSIPATVRRTVWARDNGRCAFVGTDGPCWETGFLEFHHVIPFASGGPSTAENIQLRCRAHNAHEATKDFGEWVRDRKAAGKRLRKGRQECKEPADANLSVTLS